LNGSVRSIAIERAVSEMKGWRRKLKAFGNPDLQPIAANLADLERLLTADERTRPPSAGCLRSMGTARRRWW
jgi:hypothetical protein